MIRLLLLLGAVLSWAAPAFALTAGDGIALSSGAVSTSSNSTNFLANASSLSCSSSAGKILVDSTADTLSWCSSGGSTVKYAALGDDSGDATGVAAGTVVNADVSASAAIALSKLANITSDRLLGRDTASSGAIEELTVGGGVEFTTSGGIQRSALTGDVTASAGSNTTAIASGAIVNADINSSAAIDVSKTALDPGVGIGLSGNTLSFAFSEITGPQTWGDNSGTMSWTFNTGVSDPTIDFYGSGVVDVTGTLQMNTVPVVTESGTQTLTNKTLTSPTVSCTGCITDTNVADIALGTGTSGNYVATVAGTTNEVDVSGSGSETAAVTVALPSTIDLGGKTSLEVPNAAAPTTDAFGEIAGDNNVWGSGRGALQAYDGTDTTYVIATTDTWPTNGQVPKWNTGGTITWEDDSGGGAEVVVDVTDYGAVCNGSTDDKAAFDSAYDALTTSGGVIYVPNTGSACMISGDVGVESNVKLRCQPGATLKATTGASFTLGLFSWFTSKDDTAVEDCTFDLNGKAAPALWVSGNRFSIRRNRVSNGATSSAGAYLSVTGQGEASSNTITCVNTNAIGDTGITGNGGTTSGQVVTANTVTNCNTGIAYTNNASITSNYVVASSTLASATGISGTSYTDISDNFVSMAGASSTGISMTAAGTVTNNIVSSSGASSKGISLTGAAASASNNYVAGTGTTNTGFYTTGNLTRIENNAYYGNADTGGTEAQVAFDVRGAGVRVVGNTSTFAVDESNWNVKIAGQQARIVGNYLNNGKYGVAPDNSSAATLEINAHVTGNEIWSMGGSGSAAIVAVTGWTVVGNYVSWNEYTGLLIGDDRGTQKEVANHLTVVGNRFHSNDSTGKGIVFANVGKLCDSGTKDGQSCSTDNTDSGTGCPSATCPNCCDATAYDNITITGNEFLYLNSTAPVIDIANAITASTSSTVDNVVIDGSVFDLGASEIAIQFPSSNQSLVTDVVIGDVSFDGYTAQGLPIANFTSAMGNLTMYPQVVADLPAANCVAATAVSFWNQPSATQPLPACLGSTYARGVLAFDASTDETVYTDIVIPPKWTGWLYADIWWGTSDTTSHNAIWGIQGVCLAAGENYDPSFSSTANTVTSANVATFANYLSKGTITLSNASNNPLVTCAAGETLVLKLYRDADNGSDNVSADANLHRVVLRQW